MILFKPVIQVHARAMQNIFAKLALDCWVAIMTVGGDAIRDNAGHRSPVLARSLTEPTSLLCTLAAVATFHAPVIAHATPSPASPAGDALGDGRLPRRSNEDRAR
jgi:hypothetical protein